MRPATPQCCGEARHRRTIVLDAEHREASVGYPRPITGGVPILGTSAGLAGGLPDPNYLPPMGLSGISSGIALSGPLASGGLGLGGRPPESPGPKIVSRDSPGFVHLEFGIARSARYHQKRRDFFNMLHRLSLLIVAISSSGTFVAALGDGGSLLVRILAAIAAVVAASDTSLGFTSKVSEYNSLQARFRDVAARMAFAKYITEDDLRNWEAEKTTIEKDEPAQKYVLNIQCRNEEARARGYPEKEIVPLRWYQSAFAQFVSL